MKRPLISLCMIVKNEEKYLKKCLDSMADLFDEVIITDTGSTDSTKEIASSYPNVKIFDFEWINDFSAARNFSFSKAISKYIMWVDADDILIEEDREKFKELKKVLEENYIPTVSMTYKYAFDENNNCTLEFKRNRIILNNKKNVWEGYVHEIIGRSILESYPSDVAITHTRNHSNGTRNLDIFENKRKENPNFNTRDTLYYAKELYYNNKNIKALEIFNEFFNREDKWIEDEIDARIKVADIYKRLNDDMQIINQLMKANEIEPRAEAIYPLANYYYNNGRINTAIAFYEMILNLDYPENSAGFLNRRYWEILPCIQLSVCYYNKDKNKAKKYHEMAKNYEPNNKLVLYNNKFF